MKKTVLLFLIVSCLLIGFTGCSSQKKLEGNWETVALIKDGKPQEVVASNINFVVNENGLKANGRAGVNLFVLNAKTKGNKINTYGMQNTGFNGIYSAMEFEDMFFDVVMNSTSYKVKGSELYIYAPERNMEIQFKKTE